MIPLRRTQLPASKDELAQAIEQEVRRHLRKTGPIVDVRSRVFPYIDEIAINLDRAELDPAAGTWPQISGEAKPAFEVATLNLNARGINLHGTPIDLRLEARDVFLHQVRDANREIVLVGHKVHEGEISISALQLDLETLVAKVIAAQARSHGIGIDQVRLALRQRGPRSVGAEIRIEARKFLVRAKIDIYGQVDVDEQFVATISQLRCQGVGAIASRACSALNPHLQRFNGRSFSLKSLPLGQAQLRDLRIAVTDAVEINLSFGSDREKT